MATDRRSPKERTGKRGTTRLSSRAGETSQPNRVSQQVAAEAEAQEAFIQLAAHELRTPLTVLHGMLQLVLVKPEISDATCRPLIESAYVAAQRIQAIIDSLTEITRLRSGEIALQLQSVDLNSVASSAHENLRENLPGWHIQVVPHIEPIAVMADPFRLQQAVTHAVNHVVERAPTEGAVELRVVAVRRSACIEVEGQGPSLRRPPTASQVREHREPAAGSAAPLGLRLYVAEQLLRLHGGEMDVRTEPDVRLAVRLWLPLMHAAKR